MGLSSSPTTLSTGFWGATLRAGAIWTRICVSPRLFGPTKLHGSCLATRPNDLQRCSRAMTGHNLETCRQKKAPQSLRCCIKSLWTDRVNVQEVKNSSLATMSELADKLQTQHHNHKAKSSSASSTPNSFSFRLGKCRHYRYLLAHAQRTIYNGSD